MKKMTLAIVMAVCAISAQAQLAVDSLGNVFVGTNITDGSFFNNSTFKLVVDKDGLWRIYKNGVLVFEPNAGVLMSNTAPSIVIGSASNSINNAVITGMRVY